MMKGLMLLCFCTLLPTCIWANDCCAKEAIGCFKNEGDFSHFTTEPYCIEQIKPKINLFSQANTAEGQMLDLTAAIPSNFNNQRRTIFLVHGFLNTYDAQWLHDVKDALLEKADVNVVIVGWGGGANLWPWEYDYAASNTRAIGALIGRIMNRLKTEEGLDASNIWCVGHSLGAHVCGFAGSMANIGRITGLDPADPSFYREPEAARLDAGDADFVDIIHTDSDDNNDWVTAYGLLPPVGDVDFYPNGGMKQPDCWTKRRHDKRGLSCSHSRAPMYFLDSIRHENCFPARHQCGSAENIPATCFACDTKPGGVCGKMGYQADELIGGEKASGILYLTTTDGSGGEFCQY